MIKLENVSKSYVKGKKSVDTLNLEIKDGEIFGFLGPNGAGKTTTIKLILGLQSITSGKVSINGYDIEKDFKNAIKNVGAIVENPDMYMYLSGYQNLKLVANLYKNIGIERIDEVVKLVKLEKRINDKVSKYSLGMRQRLGIAQAILHKPNLLILDEPTNGLDPEGIKEMRELLVNLAEKEKMAILISSHNLAELDNFCTKVCIIKNGEVIETSEISKIKHETSNEVEIFELDNAEKAEKILSIDLRNNKILELEVKNNRMLKVNISKEEVPYIISKLVENNIKIYEVKQEEKTLEDAFFEKTGGNVIE